VLVAVSLSARILYLASLSARWVATPGWMRLGAAALCIALPGLMPMSGGSAHAGIGLEERKLSMKFGRIIPCYRLLDSLISKANTLLI